MVSRLVVTGRLSTHSVRRLSRSSTARSGGMAREYVSAVWAVTRATADRTRTAAAAERYHMGEAPGGGCGTPIGYVNTAGRGVLGGGVRNRPAGRVGGAGCSGGRGHFLPIARLRAKKSPRAAAQRSASTPPITWQRWFSRGSEVIW